MPNRRKQQKRRAAVPVKRAEIGTSQNESVQHTAEQTVSQLEQQIGIMEGRYERALRAEGFTAQVKRAGILLALMTTQRSALLRELGTPMQAENPYTRL